MCEGGYNKKEIFPGTCEDNILDIQNYNDTGFSYLFPRYYLPFTFRII